MQALYTQRDVFISLQGCSKPDDKKFLLKPVSQAMGDAKALKGKDPKVGNHIQTISDGLNLFGWFLAVNLKEYVDEHLGGIDFYGNKVL